MAWSGGCSSLSESRQLGCPAWHQGDDPVSESRYPFLGFYCLFCLCVDFASPHRPLDAKLFHQVLKPMTSLCTKPAGRASCTPGGSGTPETLRPGLLLPPPVTSVYTSRAPLGPGPWGSGQPRVHPALRAQDPSPGGLPIAPTVAILAPTPSSPLSTQTPEGKLQVPTSLQPLSPQCSPGALMGTEAPRGVSRAPTASDCLLGPDGTQGWDFSRLPG